MNILTYIETKEKQLPLAEEKEIRKKDVPCVSTNEEKIWTRIRDGEENDQDVFFARTSICNTPDETNHNHSSYHQKNNVKEENNKRSMNTNDISLFTTTTDTNTKHPSRHDDHLHDEETNSNLSVIISSAILNQSVDINSSKVVADHVNIKEGYTPILPFTIVIQNNTNDNNKTNKKNNVYANHNRDEQYVDSMLKSDKRASIETANVDDGGENQRDREKGEREKNRRQQENAKVDNDERTREHRRERKKQASK